MTTTALFFRDAERFLFILIVTCGFCMMASASVWAGEPELLSDQCIADVTAGTVNSMMTAFYETPTTAYIDAEPRWWGDMDGFGKGCGANPGFVVTNIPYADFQYDTFKYSFKNQAAVDEFLTDLSSSGGAPVRVVDTNYIKGEPRAENAFSGDGGRATRVQEVIITTDRKIDGFFVRDHGGEVITQDVRFDLEFMPPYAMTRTIKGSSDTKQHSTPILEQSLTFRNYLQYEWRQNNKLRPDTIRNDDGTYYFVQRPDVTYNFGAVFLETGVSGDDGIYAQCGRMVVPPQKVYLKNSIFNDIHVYCPAFGMTVGLAPRGEPIPDGELVFGGDGYYPDLNRYQELGVVDIRHLNVYLKGGNDIYVYANEELNLCQ